MKKVVVFFLVVFFMAMSPLHLSNAYLRSSDFDTVTVHHNESVWSIAQRYTADDEHTASLMEAIVEINALESDGSVRVGQQLKVPLLDKGSVQVAAR